MLKTIFDNPEMKGTPEEVASKMGIDFEFVKFKIQRQLEEKERQEREIKERDIQERERQERDIQERERQEREQKNIRDSSIPTIEISEDEIPF